MLRGRSLDFVADDALLRIVKQPAEWTFSDGRSAAGHLEYHDLVEDGVCVGFITKKIKLSQPAVTEHMQVLAAATRLMMPEPTYMFAALVWGEGSSPFA